MHGALPLSIALHAGALAAILMAVLVPGADESAAESVSVEIISMEMAVARVAGEIVTEANETLVSAGADVSAAEAIEPVEIEEVAEIAPPTETAQPVAAGVTESVKVDSPASAEVLVAQPMSLAPLAGLLPQRVAALAPEVAVAAPAVIATIDPMTTQAVQPAEAVPIEMPDPLRTAALAPMPVEELQIAPIPRPRLERAPPEPKAEPEVAKTPATKAKPKPKPAPDKPAENKTQPSREASLGNGGADQADSQSSKAAGGKGKKSDGGSAAVGKYPGQVQARVTRATRYPKQAKGADGEAQVTFTVAANGGVSRVSLARSAGHPALDDAALAAVERAAPFPPIPEDAGRSSWTFTVPIRFNK